MQTHRKIDFITIALLQTFAYYKNNLFYAFRHIVFTYYVIILYYYKSNMYVIHIVLLCKIFIII